MSKALGNLKSKNNGNYFLNNEDFEIKASHLYIKFKPRNEEEEGMLKSDSTLYLFDYRLDVEYKDAYLDKRNINSHNSIPDYYTSISINRIIPNVPYEIIDELYIPEQDDFFDDTVENEK